MRFIKGDSLKEAIGLFHGEDTRKGGAGQRSLELRRLLGRIAEAFSAYSARGWKILERLISESPAIIEFRRLQARCLSGCGDSARELGDPSEALTYFREARSLEASGRCESGSVCRWLGGGDLAEPDRLAALRDGPDRGIHQGIQGRLGGLPEARGQFPPQDVHRTLERAGEHHDQPRRDPAQAETAGRGEGLWDQASSLPSDSGKEYPAIVDYRATGRVSAAIGPDKAGRGRYSSAAADRRRALLVNQDLPPRTGEEAIFEAGCHAMLSSVAGMSGLVSPATDRPAEVEKAMAILRRNPRRRLPMPPRA